MDAVRSPGLRPYLLLVPVLIISLLGPVPARGDANNARAASGPYILPEAQDALLELWGQGQLRDNAMVRAIVARRIAELGEAERDHDAHDHPRAIPEVQPWMGPGSQALGPDVIANDRSLSNCLCPSGTSDPRPVTQSEPSVAAYGPYVVASWNDRRGACVGQAGSKMSYAYSRDNGATFTEGQLISTPPTGNLRADPTVAANPNTGAWYISGLGSGGVGVVKGHFTDTGFTIDFGRQINTLPGESFDKPWMAVDSTSGNVYVTWTSFPADQSSKIVLQRLDADLNPLGPIQELRYTAPYDQVGYGAQVSFTAVGPDGVVYVAWHIYYSNLNLVEVPASRYEIVRSDDYGQTFGPVRTIADMGWSIVALAPGNQRGIWAGVIALAVDMTHGPHRGRVYATWAEIPIRPDFVPTGPTVDEVENNDYFASAMPITPGGRIRGIPAPSGNDDFFKFEGQRGQVLRIWPETLNNQRIRLICPADTTTRANYHHLGLGSHAYVCGLPYDGTYYIQVTTDANSNYQIATVVEQAPPGGRVQDVKDAFVAWSDDGATWSTPMRLNDDMPGSDTQQVGVSVDGRGRVHAFWFDWRDDPECGVISNQYTASSGDGGVTWGANRKLSDAPSFWGALASCSANNQGDYSHMAASGDYVYSAFPDMRMGDPDVFVDVSRLTPVAGCPEDVSHLPGVTVTLDFPLANQGNFDTPLAWRVTDSAGWLTGATPALEGSQTLAGGGGTLIVQATVALPPSCNGAWTVVEFVSSDPFVPGYAETCRTVVRCETPTPTALSLVGSTVRNGTVTLTWHGGSSAGAAARVDRRADGGAWVERGEARADAAGRFRFEESVPPGRYVYRLEVLEGADAGFSLETPVEVPSFAFALNGASADPSGAGLRVSYSLASEARARLEVLDVAGRIVAARELQGPGAAEVQVGGRNLASGVYVVRLSQGGATATAKAVLRR